MREFLYKNGFFRYAAAINSCNGKRMPIIAPFVAFYCLIILGIASGISSGNVAGAVAGLIASVLFFAATIAGTFRNASPNLAKLMPVSGKRKFLYDFLVALYYALIAVLVAALIGGVVALFVWAVTAAGGAEAEEEVSEFFSTQTGVYGGIFSAAYIVILYSAGMISGYFKSRKHRNLFYTVFVICIALGIIFSGLPCLIKGVQNPDLPPLASPFSSRCYDYMSLPWLFILIWCLIAAGMFAVAVYRGWKYHKPNKY